MLTNRLSVVIFILLIQQLYCWEALPFIPSEHRSQFFFLQNDGSYTYGYGTGDGIAAKQSADSANQVSGSYSYQAPSVDNINVKYTSGVQGFVPETLPTSAPIPQTTTEAEDDQSTTGDASYNFSFDTPTYRRSEISDSRGNVQGTYSYIDDNGVHDLSFIAGENIGFVPTSGSLSKPNGLITDQIARIPLVRTRVAAKLDRGSTTEPSVTVPPSAPTESTIIGDSFYASTFPTDDSSREASTDGAGLQATTTESTVIPSVPETTAGSFVASSGTGFQSIGGSPLGLTNTQNLQKPLILEQSTSYIASGLVPVVPVVPTRPARQQSDYKVIAHSFVPTSGNDRKLFGYIFDTL